MLATVSVKRVGWEGLIRGFGNKWPIFVQVSGPSPGRLAGLCARRLRRRDFCSSIKDSVGSGLAGSFAGVSDGGLVLPVRCRNHVAVSVNSGIYSLERGSY